MMTRSTLLIAALAATLPGLAQRANSFPAQLERSTWTEPERPWSELNDQRAGGDILFQDDFANGLAGNNGVGAWTTTGPDGALWLYDTNGPNGDFSSTTERIQSATVSNGFMIFDSNLSNDGCSGASCINREGYLVSPVLDLSATPFAHLIYTQRLRWCCSSLSGHFVDVSTDGFATSTRFEAIRDHYINHDPGTYTMRINLYSAIQGNPANVQFRFAHDGTATTSLTHYHWQLDDVQVTESYGNDVGLLNARHASFVPNETDTDILDFTIYPQSQLRVLNMGSPVRNEGVEEATNVTLNISVTDPSNATIFTASPSVASLEPDSVTGDLRADFTPPAVAGLYTVSFNLEADAEDERTVDNSVTRTFRVSPYTYAYDNGARDGQYFRPAVGGVFPESDAGNLFYIENSAMAYGVHIALASGTNTGTQIGAAFDGVVYRFDTDPPELVAETDITSVTSTAQLTGAGQARFFELRFINPVQLEAGVEYAACVRSYGGNLRLSVATSGFARPVTSLVRYPEDDGWRVITPIPMVRLSFDPTTSIEDTDRRDGVGLGQNVPNPANGTTAILYELQSGAQTLFEVHDLGGKLVMERNEGLRSPGVHRVELNTDALQPGMYFYSIVSNGVRMTKRMTVIR